MIIKKKAGTYDVYTVECSYGELLAFKVGLESDHADPVRDEKLAELSWYLERIPGPGQEEEKAGAKGADAAAGGVPGEEGDDVPIPMPPGSQAGTPPDTGADEPLMPPDEDVQEPGNNALTRAADAAQGGGADAGLPEPGMDEAPAPADTAAPRPKPSNPGTETDRRLPKPPRE